MKKFILVFFGLILILSAVSLARIPFTTIYWIKGRVEGAGADGMKIYFENTGAWDTIGANGASGKPGHFVINAGEAGIPLEVGMEYRLFSERINNYGVGPINIEITGTGIEDAGNLALVEGGGVAELAAYMVSASAAPTLKIWFGNRLYQEDLVEKGIDFFVPRRPKIKMEVEVAQALSLDADLSGYSITVDDIETHNFSTFSYSKNKATLELTLPVELSPGKHNIAFKASSAGAEAVSTTFTAKVTVAGGPLKILDTPLSYPSPFNPERDKQVTFQYTLSDDAAIDIFIFNIATEIIKKISIPAGADGGSGQLNKVSWDGMTDRGSVVSNGVFLVNIVSREENRVLGRIRMSVHR